MNSINNINGSKALTGIETMEIRALKYLLSLAELGSFTAAAKAHYVTQPAVSIQLRKMQEEIGETLFEVEGRKIRFTHAGEIVLDYARKVSDLERETTRRVQDIRGLQRGRVILGTIDAASIYVLPEVFSQFRSRYQGIDVQLVMDSTRPLLGELEEGRVDLVIGTLPFEGHDMLDVFPIYSEELVVIAPRLHPLAGMRGIEAGMLADYPFISFHEESITRGIIEEGLLRHGVHVHVDMAIDSPEAIKKLVSSGLGLAVLPRKIVESDVDSGALSVLTCKGLRFERRLGLILYKGRYLSTTIRAFLEVLAGELGIELPDALDTKADI
jgi:DNA-binding transcriptional LysR family regulator